MKNKKKPRALAVLGAGVCVTLGVFSLYFGWPYCLSWDRYGVLACAVRGNLSFKHMLPGVDGKTLAALRGAATFEDIPLLERMQHDKDSLLRLAAGQVLAEMRGENPSLSAMLLLEKLKTAHAVGDTETALRLMERLAAAGEHGRQQLVHFCGVVAKGQDSALAVHCASAAPPPE